MSIERLKKVTIMSQLQRKDEVLSALQETSSLHLIDMRDDMSTAGNRPDGDKNIQRFNQAITYLSAVNQKRKYLPLARQVDLSFLIDKVLKNKESKHDLTELRDDLLERIEHLRPWGSFHLPSVEALGGNKLWLYLLPYKNKVKMADLNFPWKILFSNHRYVWLSVISKEEPVSSLLSVKPIHCDGRSLQDVYDQLQDVESELEEVESERQGLTRYLNHFQQGRDLIYDQSELEVAKQLCLVEEAFFTLRAWVSEDSLDTLKDLSQSLDFAVYAEDVSADETPPTLLKNAPSVAGGELLVGFYQMPSYNSWDPSFMLFASFCLFFSMILSDAGYALVLIVLLTALSPKIRKTLTGRKLFPLLSAVSFCSLVWGILVGSYFGFGPENRLLMQLHILDVHNFDHMMALSIGCGVVHLILANFYQILATNSVSRSVHHGGWILLLIGATGFGFSQNESTFKTLSLVGSILGLIIVFVSASDRKLDSKKALFLSFLDGLKALTSVTNLFGDVLSYLRLFALGLASASLALTFNQLADQAFNSTSGFSLLFGVLILLIGHTLNLVLGIVSGVVHGLRLNYIEFYKWALYGEGYPFKVFKKIGVSK